MAEWFRYAALLGLNPYHPGRWSAEDHEQVLRWRLAQFRAHWKWMSAQGQPALIRQQSGRAALIREVKDDLRRALSPLPGNTYKHCPCHPHRFGGDGKRRSEGEPWDVDRPTGWPSWLAALAWLAATFGRKRKRARP
jgi:hypothetical protein